MRPGNTDGNYASSSMAAVFAANSGDGRARCYSILRLCSLDGEAHGWGQPLAWPICVPTADWGKCPRGSISCGSTGYGEFRQRNGKTKAATTIDSDEAARDRQPAVNSRFPTSPRGDVPLTNQQWGMIGGQEAAPYGIFFWGFCDLGSLGSPSFTAKLHSPRSTLKTRQATSDNGTGSCHECGLSKDAMLSQRGETLPTLALSRTQPSCTWTRDRGLIVLETRLPERLNAMDFRLRTLSVRWSSGSG